MDRLKNEILRFERLGSFVSINPIIMLTVVYFLWFTSLVSVTGSHTEDEPDWKSR